MPKQALVTLTESMFYVLMAFQNGPMCGVDIADYIDQLTNGRIHIGPGTLYTILSKFLNVRFIQEIEVEGRKRTYKITQLGTQAYQQELERIQLCLQDAMKGK